MNHDDEDAEWLASIQAIGQLTQEMTLAGYGTPAERRAELTSMSPKWWRNVEHVCMLYIKSGGARPFPPDIAYIFADIAAVIATGNMPELIELAQKPAKRAGRPAKTKGEERAIQIAVTYHQAAQPSGIYNRASNLRIHIDDADPVATIVRCFGLEGRSGVTKWLQQKHPLLDLSPEYASAENLRDLLTTIGEEYRRYGRSYKRSSKKPPTPQ